MNARVTKLLGGRRAVVVALVAGAALLLVPAGASAAAPVLEFVIPGHSFPVSFTTESGEVSAQMAGFEVLVHCTASHGKGEVTGPRSTVSEYQLTGCTASHGSEKCQSAGAANEEEITTGPIDSDLVWIDQAKDQVGILMNPGGGTYIAFKCGGESAEGKGSFLAPVNPINKETTSFTATLSQADSVQTPDQYENEKGEALYAFPTGEREGKSFVPTGVEAAFTITSSVSGYIKAVSAHDIEAKEQEEALQKQEAALKKQEGSLGKLEAALVAAEEHTKQLAEEAKKHEEALSAQIAANKKHQEEEAAANKKHQEEEAAKKKQDETKPPTRAQMLAKALEQCKKTGSKHKQMQCEKLAKNKYGHKAKTGKK